MNFLKVLMSSLVVLVAYVAAYRIRRHDESPSESSSNTDSPVTYSESSSYTPASPVTESNHQRSSTQTIAHVSKYCVSTDDCNQSGGCRCAAMVVGPKQCKCLGQNWQERKNKTKIFDRLADKEDVI